MTLQAPLLADLTVATALHRAGQLARAEACYRQLLRSNPRDVRVLTGLGACLAQTGRHEQAAAALRSAVAVSTDPATAGPALANLANVLDSMGRLDEALAAVEQARAAMPGNVALLVNHGNLLRRMERDAEAFASYEAALLREPRNAPARLARGILRNAAAEHRLALEDLTIAVDVAPQDALAHYNLGVVLQALDRLPEALAAFESSLARAERNADAWLNLGIVRKALGQPDAALQAIDRALALGGPWPEALASRGHLLQEAGDAHGALACYEQALQGDPDNGGLLLTRGEALRKLLRCNDAIESYQRGLQIAPTHPDAPGAHLNLAICQLLVGDLLPGWREFEWRWGDTAIQPAHAYPLDRLWTGQENPAGRTVLVHHEQGFGDTLQFCRYVPLLAKRGARVVLEIPPPLQALLDSLDGVAQLRSPGDPPCAFDLHTPLLTLPLAFATTLSTVPARVPYLAAPARQRALWRAKLEPEPRPRIGVAWAGNPNHGNDANRSIPLDALRALVQSPAGGRCAWFSVQRDVRDGDEAELDRLGVRHFGHELVDFADTGALMEVLDLVISVDTSAAHLAGSLARPLWVLLPHVPDWRWMLDRADTPWYPQARLFRQTAVQDWAMVVDGVAKALEEALADPGGIFAPVMQTSRRSTRQTI